MDYHQQLEQWVQRFIIGHNICPFAKRPATNGSLRTKIVETEDEQVLNQALLAELQALIETSPTVLSTTLLGAPQLLADFDDFYSYVEWTTEILEELNLVGIFQIIGFHPHYYFEGSNTDDLANYTNRSPFPILHILRESSVTEVVSLYPDTAIIPQRNIQYLRQLDRKTLEQLRLGQ